MRFLPVLALSLLFACDGDDPPARLFPDDWQSTFVQVRGCRASPDHDLEHVALWIDPGSKALWDACVDAFPDGDSTCTERFAEGATFLKPQYLDPGCTQILRFSVSKRADGFDKSGGWHWQEVVVDGDRQKVSEDGALQRCAGCHATCAGYDLRCYMDE